VTAPNEAEVQRFSRRLGELRREVQQIDPELLARNTASKLQRWADETIEFHLEMWERPVRLTYPALEAFTLESGVPGNREPEDPAALPLIDQAMLLYYFSSADGLPLSGRWISFAELPDGRFYNQAFQGYTGLALRGHFGDQGERFSAAAQHLDGIPYPLGSAAFAFQALPRAPLMAIFWEGDEDFPPSYQVLFDGAANHYLPTDAYAILGSTLTRRLIKADRSEQRP
jgi:hypothetical protein